MLIFERIFLTYIMSSRSVGLGQRTLQKRTCFLTLTYRTSPQHPFRPTELLAAAGRGLFSPPPLLKKIGEPGDPAPIIQRGAAQKQTRSIGGTAGAASALFTLPAPPEWLLSRGRLRLCTSGHAGEAPSGQGRMSSWCYGDGGLSLIVNPIVPH